MEMQMKEMMDAMRSEMQGTIRAQQARIEWLESQQAMGGLVAPTATRAFTQQSYACTSSFNCHCSSHEVQISKKGREKK
ncbi:hypothetical protein ACSBR1_015896 [Camellia fascicularis]